MKYDIFISFATEDSEEVHSIYEFLKSTGYEVFLSEESLKDKMGMSFVQELEEALSNSRNLLVYCSASAMKSKWVTVEWQTFFTEFYMSDKNHQRSILLYRGNNFSEKEIPLMLRTFQMVDQLASITASLKTISENKPEVSKPDSNYEKIRQALLKREDGTQHHEGIIEIAKDWISLLNDKTNAHRCMKKALKSAIACSGPLHYYKGLMFFNYWIEMNGSEHLIRKEIEEFPRYDFESYDYVGLAAIQIRLFKDSYKAKEVLQEAMRNAWPAIEFTVLSDASISLLDDKYMAVQMIKEAERHASTRMDYSHICTYYRKLGEPYSAERVEKQMKDQYYY